MKYKRIICFVDDSVLVQHENGASILCNPQNPTARPFPTSPYSVMAHMPYSEFKPAWAVEPKILQNALETIEQLPDVEIDSKKAERLAKQTEMFLNQNPMFDREH